MTVPRVLVLGGVDPTGGAGITADAQVVAWHGAQALPIAVALTVQNRRGMQRVAAVAEELWSAAITAAVADGPVQAIKTGLLASAAQIEALAARLRPLAATVPLVVDPVLSATAGGYTAAAEIALAYRRHLLPLARVVTPNLPELQALCADDPPALLAGACRAVVVKGGHGSGGELRDVLHTRSGTESWSHPLRNVGPVHGTGCAFAATLAAHLARGATVPAAVQAAVEFLQACLSAMGPADDSGLPRPLRLATRTSSR